VIKKWTIGTATSSGSLGDGQTTLDQCRHAGVKDNIPAGTELEMQKELEVKKIQQTWMETTIQTIMAT
jgi:hypothetical protein